MTRRVDRNTVPPRLRRGRVGPMSRIHRTEPSGWSKSSIGKKIQAFGSCRMGKPVRREKMARWIVRIEFSDFADAPGHVFAKVRRALA